jgi:2,5-diketo-D-gluconate reductase B
MNPPGRASRPGAISHSSGWGETPVPGLENDSLSVSAAGAAIPKIGLGTWQLRGEQCAGIVAAALRLGYNHVDTAQGYANEEFVGEGLKASGMPRDRVFITTKVRPDRMAEGDLQRSVDESLSKLGVAQIDLLLLHWPNPDIPLAGTIRALNAVKRDRRARHIGLSNFTTRLLDEAWRLTEEPFAAEQIEYHPYLDQAKMLSALRRHGMATIAYCPIALGKVAGDPDIEAIAAAHGRSAAQVTLRWLIQQPDVIAIPKTARLERLKENLDVFNFVLTGAEMAKLSALTRPGSRNVNEPQWVPEWD